MATYRLSNVTEQYTFAANPPVLDRVVFTIDHVHAGDHDICSTYEVVKFLVDKNIPVAIFIQATNPSNNYEYDRNNARMIYQLAPNLVTLGVHPLPSGHTQQEQSQVHNTIREIIKDVTGTFPAVLSYHGAGAGPEPGITFSGIKYARGIISAWAAGTDNPKNTPVMVMNSVSRAFAYTSQRNAAGYSSTIFIHTNELREGSTKKRVFDTFVQSVLDRKIQAMPYMSAMNVDFENATTPTPPDPTPSTPPNNGGSSGIGSLRLSASTKVGRRPVNADFLIEKLNGDDVGSAQSVKTQAFKLPAGQYKVTAKIGNVTETATINLTATKGIHHIFLMPAAGSGSTTPTPSPTPTPPNNTTRLGSIRLSASTKVGRRPMNVDFLIEGIDNNLVEIARNLKTKAFRIPVGRYKVTAKIGGIVETANINLTARKGIHHIFLMSAAGSGSSPTPPSTPSLSTPPANSNALGSLRLSASSEQGRRPLEVDLTINRVNGDAIRNVQGVTTQLFRLPAGQYRTTAKLGSTVVTKDIDLTANKGIHHIFLIPA
ncbi:MAG: hypothetical protein ACPG47_05585 [Leucothrix sp.]